MKTDEAKTSPPSPPSPTTTTIAATHPDTALAGILRRLLRGERWWVEGDLLYIDDSVDLSAAEQAAVLQAVREA